MQLFLTGPEGRSLALPWRKNEASSVACKCVLSNVCLLISFLMTRPRIVQVLLACLTIVVANTMHAFC